MAQHPLTGHVKYLIWHSTQGSHTLYGIPHKEAITYGRHQYSNHLFGICISYSYAVSRLYPHLYLGPFTLDIHLPFTIKLLMCMPYTIPLFGSVRLKAPPALLHPRDGFYIKGLPLPIDHLMLQTLHVQTPEFLEQRE